MNDRGGSERASAEDREKSEVSRWEWVVAALSFLIIAGVIGPIGYEAVRGSAAPPDVRIEVDSIGPVTTGYLVEFRATNSGGRTAAGLTVEGELKSGTTSVEKSQVTIDFVPPRAVRRGGLFFTRDPRQYQLELRPLGYDRP